jgi:hypothetical protein
MPVWQIDRGIAHHDAVRAHERSNQTHELGSKPLVFTDFPGADVDMGESRCMENLVPHHRQGFTTR